jgi:hypothetical protein
LSPAAPSTAGTQCPASGSRSDTVSIGHAHEEGTHAPDEPHSAAVLRSVARPRQRATPTSHPLRCSRGSRGNGGYRSCRREGTPGINEHAHTVVTDDLPHVHPDHNGAADNDITHNDPLFGWGVLISHHSEHGDAYHLSPDHDHDVPANHNDDPARGHVRGNIEMTTLTTHA